MGIILSQLNTHVTMYRHGCWNIIVDIWSLLKIIPMSPCIIMDIRSWLKIIPMSPCIVVDVEISSSTFGGSLKIIPMSPCIVVDIEISSSLRWADYFITLYLCKKIARYAVESWKARVAKGGCLKKNQSHRSCSQTADSLSVSRLFWPVFKTPHSRIVMLFFNLSVQHPTVHAWSQKFLERLYST